MQRTYRPCAEALARLTFLAERLLIARAQTGDILALDDLEVTHHPCIQRVACAFRCPELPATDLQQDGCYAFRAKAVPHYRLDQGSHERETRLWSYSYTWVWSAMRDACARWHQLSSDATRYFGRILDSARALSQTLDHAPTITEIAAAAAVKPSVVEEVLHMGHRDLPLDPLPAADAEDLQPALQLPDRGPSPETSAFGRAAYEEVIRLLGPTDGVKWLVLFLLKEAGHGWDRISGCLGGAADGPAAWGSACTDQPLPATVPRAWDGVLACFRQAPQESGANTLSAWYNQKRKVLGQQMR
ncbi:MAG: hypothetical protein M3Z04_00865 [Chloroflexota bacterium]|nr:hypothetical protein [Chloroflexota bacterium]